MWLLDSFLPIIITIIISTSLIGTSRRPGNRRKSSQMVSRVHNLQHFQSGVPFQKKKLKKKKKSASAESDIEEKTEFEEVQVVKRPARSKIHKKSALKWKTRKEPHSESSSTTKGSASGSTSQSGSGQSLKGEGESQKSGERKLASQAKLRPAEHEQLNIEKTILVDQSCYAGGSLAVMAPAVGVDAGERLNFPVEATVHPDGEDKPKNDKQVHKKSDDFVGENCVKNESQKNRRGQSSVKTLSGKRKNVAIAHISKAKFEVEQKKSGTRKKEGRKASRIIETKGTRSAKFHRISKETTERKLGKDMHAVEGSNKHSKPSDGTEKIKKTHSPAEDKGVCKSGAETTADNESRAVNARGSAKLGSGPKRVEPSKEAKNLTTGKEIATSEYFRAIKASTPSQRSKKHMSMEESRYESQHEESKIPQKNEPELTSKLEANLKVKITPKPIIEDTTLEKSDQTKGDVLKAATAKLDLEAREIALPELEPHAKPQELDAGEKVKIAEVNVGEEKKPDRVGLERSKFEEFSHDEMAAKQGEHDEMAAKQGDHAETVAKQGDHAETVAKQGDHAETVAKQGDHAETVAKQGDHAETVAKQGDHAETVAKQGDHADKAVNQRNRAEMAAKHGDHADMAAKEGEHAKTEAKQGDHAETEAKQGDHAETAAKLTDHAEQKSERALHEAGSQKLFKQLDEKTPPSIKEVETGVFRTETEEAGSSEQETTTPTHDTETSKGGAICHTQSESSEEKAPRGATSLAVSSSSPAPQESATKTEATEKTGASEKTEANEKTEATEKTEAIEKTEAAEKTEAQTKTEVEEEENKEAEQAAETEPHPARTEQVGEAGGATSQHSQTAVQVLEIMLAKKFFDNALPEEGNALLRAFFAGEAKFDENIESAVFEALGTAIDRMVACATAEAHHNFLKSRYSALNALFDAMQGNDHRYLPAVWKTGHTSSGAESTTPTPVSTPNNCPPKPSIARIEQPNATSTTQEKN